MVRGDDGAREESVCRHRRVLSSVVEPWAGPGRGEADRSSQIAKDLGIDKSGLLRWMKRADIEGKKDCLTSAQLLRLRREKRVLEMEVEILKRASAYSARQNVLPK